MKLIEGAPIADAVYRECLESFGELKAAGTSRGSPSSSWARIPPRRPTSGPRTASARNSACFPRRSRSPRRSPRRNCSRKSTAQRRRAHPRHSRANAPAETPRHRRGHPPDRSLEGRGWPASRQSGQTGDGRSHRLRPLHSGGLPTHARRERDRDGRETCRHRRTQSPRREKPRLAHDGEGKGANATVTVAHSRTRDLPSITRQADILVAAIGIPRFIGADHVREGAVVIDVGINRIEDATAKGGSRLVGDVDFDAVAGKMRGHHSRPWRRRQDDHRHAHGQHDPRVSDAGRTVNRTGASGSGSWACRGPATSGTARS